MADRYHIGMCTARVQCHARLTPSPARERRQFMHITYMNWRRCYGALHAVSGLDWGRQVLARNPVTHTAIYGRQIVVSSRPDCHPCCSPGPASARPTRHRANIVCLESTEVTYVQFSQFYRRRKKLLNWCCKMWHVPHVTFVQPLLAKSWPKLDMSPKYVFCPWGGEGLGSTQTIHLRLIGKRIVDFLVVLIGLFARCYGWGDTSENRLKIGVLQRVGSVYANFSCRKGRLPPIIFARIDRRMNALQLCRWQFSHKETLYSRFSSSKVRV